MAVLYEIPDIKIEDQALSADDVKLLLAQEVISPVTLVKRVSEINALPLLSHPDFQDTWDNQTLTSPSKNLVLFLNKLEETTRISPSKASANKEESAERRKDEILVFLSQGTKTISGTLIDRSSQGVRVMTTAMGIKVGQTVDVLIVTSQSKDKQKGTVKSFVERADRRKRGSFFYIYEITLGGIFRA
ncbi:hypothetical protein [Bdellovibrio sp. HCB337]|uniref:hypothetical protein n=1 Tax=Bdellovibrio sp. HCB337 TaxID=3394358 RepID=UPI0039A4FCA8